MPYFEHFGRASGISVLDATGRYAASPFCRRRWRRGASLDTRGRRQSAHHGRRRHSVPMSDTSHRGRWLASIRRLFRWEPKSYWQVWLSAAAAGVIWFIAWSARGELLVAVVCAGIITLAGGAAGSWRLGRRRDAITVAEWTSSRRVPPPGP